MYLYLRADLDVEDVPAELRAHTGPLEAFLELTLTPERGLARVDARQVMAALSEQGYYLQLPPGGLARKPPPGDG